MKKISTFTERFKDATAGMTGIEAADLLNVSRSTISFYVTGQRVPREPTAVYIASCLGVNPFWLQGYDVEKYDAVVNPRREPESTQSEIPEDADPDVREYMEIKQVLDLLKERPECRTLFSLARTATAEDIRRAIKIIEALRE